MIDTITNNGKYKNIAFISNNADFINKINICLSFYNNEKRIKFLNNQNYKRRKYTEFTINIITIITMYIGDIKGSYFHFNESELPILSPPYDIVYANCEGEYLVRRNGFGVFQFDLTNLIEKEIRKQKVKMLI